MDQIVKEKEIIHGNGGNGDGGSGTGVIAGILIAILLVALAYLAYDRGLIGSKEEVKEDDSSSININLSNDADPKPSDSTY